MPARDDDELLDLAERWLDKGLSPKAVHRRLVEQEGLTSKRAARLLDELLEDEEEDEEDEEEGETAEDYASRLLDRGLKPKQVCDKLVKEGLTPKEAARVVRALTGEPRSKRCKGTGSDRGTAVKNMAVGGIICLIGIAITVGTMMAAGGGGTVVVAWGAIVFGGIQFLLGLGQLFM